jgi:Cu/Ag efflux pump CusA
MVALVPLIVSGTVPGQEIAQPIAIVVFGGLITTTLVTAFVVPAMYAVLGPRREAEEPSTIELATT